MFVPTRRIVRIQDVLGVQVPAADDESIGDIVKVAQVEGMTEYNRLIASGCNLRKPRQNRLMIANWPSTASNLPILRQPHSASINASRLPLTSSNVEQIECCNVEFARVL